LFLTTILGKQIVKRGSGSPAATTSRKEVTSISFGEEGSSNENLGLIKKGASNPSPATKMKTRAIAAISSATTNVQSERLKDPKTALLLVDALI
jgi:hypothetical protein